MPNYKNLKGSERKALAGARSLGPAHSTERLQVTVRLRRQNPLPALDAMARQLPKERRYVSPNEYKSRHGADPADFKKVEAFAAQRGLVVVESNLTRRTMVLSGTVAAFSDAFQVKLENYAHAKGTYRGRTGPIQVPSELDGIIEGVFGLDNRPFARPHFSRFISAKTRTGVGKPTFTPPELAKVYNFPPGADGSGQCIGIIELGGGFVPDDLTAYFDRLGIPTPTVVAVSVDEGTNSPTGDPNGPDGEVMLDIEVAAAVAPAAKIAVYFTPDASDASFLDALTTAIQDETNKPSVISISWGGPESSPTQSFMEQFDQALQSAAALGITVCCAAGDDGAADERANEWDDKAHVDFPASSPFSLACGGTNLVATDGDITSETVWNQHGVDPQSQSFGSTGGGVSEFFQRPSWQDNANVPMSVNGGSFQGRGVPDVAGDADPATGYDIQVDGQFIQGFGGTSAVAPLWAGLIALINQKLGTRAGFINALLYNQALAAGALHDVTSGDNKVGSDGVGYSAQKGWDACTGLGSPDGQKLLAALGG
jgi:kumamolisin